MSYISTNPDWVPGSIVFDGNPNKPAPSVHDVVNHPQHYTTGGIETIDFIEAKKLGFNLGNVVKYIARSDHKGKRLEDLKKAMWYLQREVHRAEAESKPEFTGELLGR